MERYLVQRFLSNGESGSRRPVDGRLTNIRFLSLSGSARFHTRTRIHTAVTFYPMHVLIVGEIFLWRDQQERATDVTEILKDLVHFA